MNLQSLPNTRQTTPSPRRVYASMIFAALIAVVLFMALARAAGAQAQQPLAPNAPAAGNLTSRFGDAWLLYACAGDSLTVTITSTAFSPYLELYEAGQELPMIEAGGDGATTLLTGAPITQTGFYTVAILGDRLSARGTYTLVATLVATTTAALTESTATAETPDFYIAANQSATGTVASRFGDLWQMHLCAGTPVTVTLYTTSFTPVLDFAAELSGTLSLITAAGDADESNVLSSALSNAENPPQWAAALFTPTHTIDLQITVGGERRSDRGPYTLLVETAPLTATAGATGATGATERAPATPAAPPPRPPTATPFATSPDTQSCRVLVQSLRLRSGPGTNYEPPIGALPQATLLEILGRSADGGWLNVRVQGSSLSGWVSAGTQYVECNVPTSGLPVITAPPTSTAQPTSTATNTPLPRPTPTPPAFVIVPGTGAGGSITGNLRTGENVAQVEDGIMRFTNQLWFFADPETPEGRRIDHVEFIIFGNEQPDAVHEQSEGSPLYCVFGGGEPNCNVLDLSPDARWPSTGLPVLNDTYQITTRIFLDGDDEDNPSGSWFATIRIQSPNLQNAGEESAPVEPPPAPEEASTIQVELREVGPGSPDRVTFGTIVFQVAAWDPAVGNNNGDGIEAIDMAIKDDDGNTLYQRTERMAAYCAFAGGEPDCNIYDYAGNGYVWEGGAPVVPGLYWLTASVHASDGRVVSHRWDIDVQ